MQYYTYNQSTKRLTLAPDPAKINGELITHPTAAMYALIDAYPLGTFPAPTPPEGKAAVRDGYELENGEWKAKWIFVDPPAPTLADFDAAMEEHLTDERFTRGYTTREPDVYLNSQVPRWASDARDWIAHRDEVMLYALEIMNAVEAGTREPPTLEEFKAGLPQIVWSYAE